MFLNVALFELRYQLRQPLFWISSAIFFLLTFGAMTSPNIQLGAGGSVLANSPYAIVFTLLILSIFSMFSGIAFVANVVVRDDETGMGAMVRSTSVGKAQYLFGRFLGAWIVSFLVFLFVPLGMMLGAAMPWLDPETVGPFRPDHYLWVTFLLVGPSLFFTGAAFFMVATLTRSMMGTYVAMIVFLVGYLTATNLLNQPELREWVARLEPFGIAAFGQETRYWTVAQRNTELPAFAGTLLFNRLLWIGMGFAALAGAYAFFKFEGKAGAKAKKRRKLDVGAEAGAGVAKAAPKVEPSSNAGLGTLLVRTRFEVREVLRNPAFLVLLLIGVLNAFGGLIGADEIFGTPVRAVSRVMIDALSGAFTFFPLLISIYYAGELVWREREKRVHDIIGASAAPNWALMVPKVVALGLVLVSVFGLSTVVAMLLQVIKHAPSVEIANYFAWYVVPRTLDVLIVAALAVFVQALVPNKFVGYLAMLLYLVASIVAGALGFDHNLYLYGGSSGEPLSDLNGAGAFAAYAYWFRAYWGAWALGLLIVAYLLWRRGADTRLRPRLARLPRQLRGVSGAALGACLLAVAGLGGFIFYNTNVLNRYVSGPGAEKQLAAFEKAYLKYETLPQPTIVDVTLQVDLYPRKHVADVRGSYVLENRTGAPVQQVHVRFDPDVSVKDLTLPGGKLVKEDRKFDYYIFELAQPLAPGARTELAFETRAGQRGFRNNGNTTRVVDNGAFLSNFEFSPQLGMSRQGLLQERATRRRNGLPPELRTPTLEDDSARAHHYLRHDSDWVTARITVSTDADQIPIAPGRLVSDKIENGRHIVTHVNEQPIQHFFSVQSGRYKVARDRWNDVDLAIYHHAPHDYNVGRMMEAFKASLDYFSTNFSPYQFKQLRVIEFPAYATFAQSFANTIPFSEAIGFIADNRNPDDIDYAYYVTAHEVAHQWWAHQVIGADMQGSTMLSETLAQYSALMVMKHRYGEDQIRRFLKFELDNYLRSRGGDPLGEKPLNRVENQQYIHYRKGSLVMYLLQDIIGEEAVNRALARLLQNYAFKSAPYPRSTDLITLLKEEAPEEHHDLITDLFEKITLYDLKAKEATATRNRDGTYNVRFTVEAEKLYADDKGEESKALLAEAMDIGVFTAEPGDGAFAKENVVVFERRDIVGGSQIIELKGLKIVPPKKPGKFTLYVGVDPYNKRIDRSSSDNVVKASIGEKPAS